MALPCVCSADGYGSWKEVADDMKGVLDDAGRTFDSGDLQGARDKVNHAYYGYYEKIGFERAVKAHISGNRAAAVEYQFSDIKKKILKGDQSAKEGIATLTSMLYEDAAALDGPSASSGSSGGAWAMFIASFLIILREGFEAILIVGAIIAYLVKTGNSSKLGPVYKGSILAVAASFLMAWLLNSLAGDQGQNQEIIEGLTMFLAVAVLFYVSNFMMAKADAQAWAGYIKGKVGSSLAGGSMFALAFTAFLAVFREGAEVILFYQALLAGGGHSDMVWYGFGAGCVALVFVYLAIRLVSFKLPLKPFFVGTSLLMYVMCVAFVGAGIKELQEGDVIGATLVHYVPTVDLLGIYPTLETLIPQIIMFFICLFTIIQAVKGWSRRRQEAMARERIEETKAAGGKQDF
ncbi:MAG: FTR1 family protein [Succinivibrio sp.]